MENKICFKGADDTMLETLVSACVVTFILACAGLYFLGTTITYWFFGVLNIIVIYRMGRKVVREVKLDADHLHVRFYFGRQESFSLEQVSRVFEKMLNNRSNQHKMMFVELKASPAPKIYFYCHYSQRAPLTELLQEKQIPFEFL
jgi:hypothetical protein